MSATVISLNQKNAGPEWTAEEALSHALQCVRSGEVAADKVLIVLLDDRGTQYNRYQIQAGLDRASIVALSEMTKFAALREDV